MTGFVLTQACTTIRALAEPGDRDIVVAVNMSPSELGQYALPSLVRSMIDTQGIEPAQLELEITEEAFVGGEGVMADLEAISAMGVKLAIDDFGTGGASLAELRTLRVDRIKIDRCFVSGFVDRERHRILVQAILGIGRSFRVDVVADGVETAKEALLLLSFGCHVAQGYYFGKAMNRNDLQSWTEARDLDQSQPNAALSARSL